MASKQKENKDITIFTTDFKMYSWKITFLKGFKYCMFYLIPLLIAHFLEFYPEASSMTIGTLLVMISNWLKQNTLP